MHAIAASMTRWGVPSVLEFDAGSAEFRFRRLVTGLLATASTSTMNPLRVMWYLRHLSARTSRFSRWWAGVPSQERARRRQIIAPSSLARGNGGPDFDGSDPPSRTPDVAQRSDHGPFERICHRRT
jgi:hypothetical protein